MIALINKHRWKVYLVWITGGFIVWCYLGYLAWQDDLDAPGAIYIYFGLVIWFFVHVIPVFFLAIALMFWRWKTRKKKHGENDCKTKKS